MSQGLTYQIVRALRMIFRQGAERPAARAVGAADPVIFTASSLETHIQRAVAAFASLPPAARPCELGAWRPDHTRHMLRAWQADGLAAVTIKNRLSSLRKLAQALNALGWHRSAPDVLVPDDLYRELRRPVARGGYTSAEADRILARLATHPRGGAEAVRLARLIRCSGLRPEEAAKLLEADVDRAPGTVRVRGVGGKVGRERVIDLADDPVGRAQLQAALDDIPRGQLCLWRDGSRLMRQVEEVVAAVCATEGIVAKGLHGLRGTFAEEYLRRWIAAGVGEDEARDELVQVLGHNRRSVSYQYVPRLMGRPHQRRRFDMIQ